MMNTFFSNIATNEYVFSSIVTNLNVPEHHDCEDISGNISYLIVKAFVKYKKKLEKKMMTFFQFHLSFNNTSFNEGTFPSVFKL